MIVKLPVLILKKLQTGKGGGGDKTYGDRSSWGEKGTTACEKERTQGKDELTWRTGWGTAGVSPT